ncbi:MAG: AEC family transporter, partial [Paracoccaceae bacterium]
AMARARLIDEGAIDGVMRSAQNFAAPMLLFKSVAELDLSLALNPGLMLSFYLAAFTGFAAGFAGARYIFNRPLPDCVAIGFACLFSNSLLLGVPITERAYGTAALAGNFAIISIHSPLFYGIGITAMELVRARGLGLSVGALVTKVASAILRQPLVVGILCGFAVNLSGLPVPGVAMSAVSMIAASAIPVALFGLGGVLVRYKTEGDAATITMICGISLILHPGLTYLLGRFVFEIDRDALRSAVMTASMAPGVNAYVFANLYGVAKRVNASAVLIATALSIGTIWGWLQILP